MIIKPFLKKGINELNKSINYVDRHFDSVPDRNIPQPLFIVGVPRSGTTLTYQLITQQLQVSYFTMFMGVLYGMPNLMHRFLKLILARPGPVFDSKYGRIKGVLSPSEHAAYWLQWFPETLENGHYTDPAMVNFNDLKNLKRGTESIAAIMQKPLVFKNLYLGMNIAVLAQLFSRSRFLYVRREPVMNCQSLLIARLSRKNPEEWWSIKPPGYGNLLKLPVWMQVTEQVYQVDKIIVRDLKRYASDRFMQIDYEMICNKPKQILQEIIDWLEPLGYKSYKDVRIPDEFSLSNKIIIPEEIKKNIEEHLKELSNHEYSQ